MGIVPVDWTYAGAAHLIERAGFGATPAQVAEVAALTQQAADCLVDYTACGCSTGHVDRASGSTGRTEPEVPLSR